MMAEKKLFRFKVNADVNKLQRVLLLQPLPAEKAEIIAIILSLCMVLSVLSLGTVSVSAVSGGWSFSDIAADNITAEEQAVLDKALEGLAGSLRSFSLC